MSLIPVFQGVNASTSLPFTSKSVSASTYTLIAADAGVLIRFTNACVVTVPANVFIAGVSVLCQQAGTGEVSFVSDGTLALNVSSVFQAKTGGQNAIAKITFTSPIAAVVLGDRAIVQALLVPAYTGASNVWSTRKIVSTQTQIWEVYRSTDGATQVFGPNGSGIVDVAAIETFLGGVQGRLRTWYDPIGNAHAVQADPAKMPPISSAVGIVRTNSKGNPMVAGLGSQIMFATLSPSINSRSNYTVAQSVKKRTSSTSQDRPFALQRDSINSQTAGGTFSYSNDTVLTFRYGDGSATTNQSMANDEFAAIVIRSPGATATYGAARLNKNGTLGTTTANSTNLPSVDLTLLYLFGSLNAATPPGEFYGQVDLSETVLFRSHLSSGDITALSTELNAYH